ncbi:diacylglycerol kinase [Acinetobacter rathckeae]|uniref:diacylglycerol kinase n=1 Tax=Acinetobacter rathckeae TaxID=2605272 RepID=UPI0018A332B9|nr:diacylglycerol kinase [Acinetobacter rathckeae]MBF7688811.1 diacylglycerol kinase [Acinetobacter rathckeae]MBF7696288.1 diacylglycerol kinase [Acinetobacter rathckeae]
MSQYSPLKGQTGLKRIFNAFNYSMSGFKSAFKNEAAFRQIIYLNLILLPISCILDISKIEHILLIIVGLLAIIVELLNSAIEAVVDRISLDRHPLAKIAKDMGSAAQFVALSIIAVTWVVIVFL